ncbi:Fe-S cluster assembly ATP-binding protein [Methanohalophilus levihalophilus]|uniref:ABC transporter ATP-binding protein n=1 Tax=Methanohalophilus levihalophilus TaxID=1431282 RepID=UPI001AEB2E4C|nr:ABC transporter ATP-binding protein [Methanohalophilus levihalophilus]MBP2029569.1 Fe-S cluster assembly ATP-binding protein [Methanohalophilus levihalophilus]
MLEVKDLTVEVGGRILLNGLNLKVEKGYTNVLFGPNGAGKSAFLRTLMGFSGYNIIKGQILFNGEDITHLSVDERAKRGLGIMTQRPPNMTGVKLKDLVKVVAKEKINVEETAESLDMLRFMERDVNVGFSGGEIKRSELLQLAAQKPCFFLLDEPESGVDLMSIEIVGKTINELIHGDCRCAGDRIEHGNSALIITHTGQIMDYIEADHAYILCNGTIMCSGNPRELLHDIKETGYEGCIKCKLKNL